MLTLALFIGKSIIFGLRLLGRNGSALPGLVVEKLYPSILRKTIGTLPYGVMVVTGTNGKTTTTKTISDLLTAHGLRVLTNKTGSNFVRGIISTVASKAHLSGELRYDIAVLEQDEAHAVHLVRHVTPRGVVALNVMRDQMDRFGEIDATARLIGKVVDTATDWVVLNANDHRIARLADSAQADNAVWFGHSKELLPKFLSDDQHHHLDNLTFYEARKPDVLLSEVNDGEITIVNSGGTHKINVQLDGTHNAINAAAAMAALHATLPNAPMARTLEALSSIEPAFGRGERIRLRNGALLRLQLVKNPSGFTHSLRLLEGQEYQAIGIAINDADADGRDVSWLWDVDFTPVGSSDSPVLCGGVRAGDMAVRLKYDQVKADVVEDKLPKFLRDITGHTRDDQDQVIIFTTYTAMLQIRETLKKQGHHVPKVGL